MMYVPCAQSPFWGAGLLIKTSMGPSSVAATIRQVVAEMDKDLPVTDFGKLTDAVDASVAEPRVRTLLLALFAAVALLLAATGIFGVISYSVACRTHEIGIRVALGATHGDLVRLVMAQTGRLVGLGLAAGLLAAVGSARLIGGLLFHVSAIDLPTFALASLVFLVVATAASWWPARRAANVDPVSALRAE